jgi:hypothetical protein
MSNFAQQTGNLVNHLHARSVIGQPTPEVGMAATILGGRDRYPATIVEVFKKGKMQYVVVQHDNYKRIDENGMSECQEYEYTANPEGPKNTYRIGRHGMWERVYFKEDTKRYVISRGNGLRIGHREAFYDFTF